MPTKKDLSAFFQERQFDDLFGRYAPRDTKEDEIIDLDIADILNFRGEQIQANVNPLEHYKPHEKQLKFHQMQKDVRLYIGGNRSGKSVGGVVEDIWWAAGVHPFINTPTPPLAGRVVAVDFINGVEKILFPIFKKWCPDEYLVGGNWERSYSKRERTLHFKNGSFIEFMSYDQDLDKFSGTSRDYTHYDEEPPEDIYLECQMRLLDSDGWSWLTMTPVEGMTWVYDRLYQPAKELEKLKASGKKSGRVGIKQRPGDVELSGDSIINDADVGLIEVSSYENPYLPKTGLIKIQHGMSEDDIKSRIFGEFVPSSGLIYKDFDRKVHVIDSTKFQLSKLWPVAVSLDHGLNNPTAVLWHAILPGGRIITFDEIYTNGKTVKEIAPMIHAKNIKWSIVPGYYVADPSIRNKDPITGTSIHEEYARLGVMFSFGNNDVTGGIERVTSYVRNRMKDGQPYWQVTTECAATIWEITKYRWKKYKNREANREQNRFEVPIKKDDHAMDSLRYFLMSRPVLTSAYVPAPPRNSNANVMHGAIARKDWTPAQLRAASSSWQEAEYDDMMGVDY